MENTLWTVTTNKGNVYEIVGFCAEQIEGLALAWYLKDTEKIEKIEKKC